MNPEVLDSLTIDAFEAGCIDPNQFDHEAHVYIGWLYVRSLPLTQALARFDAALRRLTQQLGVPGKYHATITCFFLLQIGERCSVETAATWAEFRAHNEDLFHCGTLLRAYYSESVLASEAARHTFVLPDRCEPAAA